MDKRKIHDKGKVIKGILSFCNNIPNKNLEDPTDLKE